MSHSSRFLHSISKTLNPRTSSSLFANQNYRICKLNSSFTSPLLSSQRSLSTIAESPLSLPSEVQGKEGGGLSRWLLFFPGAITFGLGTWQIVRRQDKIEMLEFRRSRLGLEPLDLTSISSSLNEEPGPLEFRRVLCEGVFDDSNSIYVGPRSRSISGVTENGYYVITPLMPVPGNPASVHAPILVNRGWVPRSWRDKFLENSQDDKQHSAPESPHAGENEGSTWWKFWSRQAKAIKDQGPVTTPEIVIGVIRESEKPSIFVPANDPSSGQWFYVDVPMIARACGLPENTVYIEDIHDNIDPSKPYPLPKDINTLIRSSVMPQDHLNYTLTWYSLSAAVTFMAYKRLKTKKSRK